jgi:hypothetical protein
VAVWEKVYPLAAAPAFVYEFRLPELDNLQGSINSEKVAGRPHLVNFRCCDEHPHRFHHPLHSQQPTQNCGTAPARVLKQPSPPSRTVPPSKVSAATIPWLPLLTNANTSRIRGLCFPSPQQRSILGQRPQQLGSPHLLTAPVAVPSPEPLRLERVRFAAPGRIGTPCSSECSFAITASSRDWWRELAARVGSWEARW